MNNAFYCIRCNSWVLMNQFKNHKISHRNDLDSYPETLEEFKNRFSAIGAYEEREFTENDTATGIFNKEFGMD